MYNCTVRYRLGDASLTIAKDSLLQRGASCGPFPELEMQASTRSGDHVCRTREVENRDRFEKETASVVVVERPAGPDVIRRKLAGELSLARDVLMLVLDHF